MNRSLAKRLMGTTALVGGVLAGGALFASDADAQARLCPASSLTGTGNVSNAVCNAAGTPLPFTLTLNLNEADVFGANSGAHTSAPNSGDTPGYANSGGPGHHDWGFMRAGWLRFTFDAPAEGDQHYGFHLRLTDENAQQTTVQGKSASFSNQALNNSVSHAPTLVSREWAYFKSPEWGQIQFGSEGSGIPGVFMAPANEGPPGSAIQTLGPGTGIESILFTDVTTGQLDAGAALLGNDAMRTKGALGIRYITPNFLGSTSDYGFTFDIKYTPDGRPYNDGNFATDSFGSGSNADLGESVTPKTYMSRVRDITEATLSWEELFAKDYDVSLAIGGIYGISKNGLNSLSAPVFDLSGPNPTSPGGTDAGQATGGQKANSDLTEAVAGASLVWREALTIGGGFTYAGKSLYPSNTTAFYDNPACDGTRNCKAGHSNPGWGASFAMEYDWDRYQAGWWYQYSTNQGDFNDVGYVQVHYIGVMGGVQILKDLKAFSEVLFHAERNNHSDAVITGGGCGSTACKRNVSGVLFLVGTSLDF